ncbi:hypothetical protein [Arthrobacter globiformis]|uniref:hypothetical protein n=1 Tax=Arthrobacter globiformis TaxID=1665 RepID=UPI00278E79B4|nr:hypothetical protein [Arthrobacter globiformis]MDQ0618457.1 hypothetical protein [Arthrobacter globiformis]
MSEVACTTQLLRWWCSPFEVFLIEALLLCSSHFGDRLWAGRVPLISGAPVSESGITRF